MTTFIEGDLEVTFRNVVSVRKFGDEYRLSHCMKAVDFIVEFEDRYVFVEFKGPPNSTEMSTQSAEFSAKFMRREIDRDLKYKFRDSYLYEWASGRADKPSDYYILIADDDLEPAILDERSNELQRQLPTGKPPGTLWLRPIARDCFVFNLETWNRNLPDFPIRRIS